MLTNLNPILRALPTVLLLLLLTPTISLQAKGKPWLRGVWQGTGYQTDTNSTWPMTLTIARQSRRRVFLVDYPSLKCGGKWRQLTIGKRRATFKEVLDRGQTDCADNGRVTIQRLSSGQLLYLYSNQGSRQITASAILSRKPANN